MRVLKPEIDELRAKYGKDARRMQMEQMKLYRKVGVNMFGGCIPMLLQFPVLIALYRFFPNVIDLRQEGFLWVYDFSTYDSIADLPFTIPFYGAHISLLTILMAVSSFFYSRMNQQMTPGAMGQQMKTLQYIFPFMLVFIFNSFPAGLTYYYLLYNVLTFVQQWFFKKFLIDEAAIRAKMEEHKARPQKEGRFARFQKRLEASQRAQMEARRNPKRR
jgi:YidC/Oxa1 family membrane protein insertase